MDFKKEYSSLNRFSEQIKDLEDLQRRVDIISLAISKTLQA